jgi:hypothetical protein
VSFKSQGLSGILHEAPAGGIFVPALEILLRIPQREADSPGKMDERQLSPKDSSLIELLTDVALFPINTGSQTLKNPLG